MQHDSGSPVAWMRFAKSDLELAHSGASPGVLFEALCFHAQQAVEKAIKAVLIAAQVPVHKTHNIEFLMGLLPDNITKPALLMESVILTDYAVIFRYPGEENPVDEQDYEAALYIADAVVKWADAEIRAIRTAEGD